MGTPKRSKFLLLESGVAAITTLCGFMAFILRTSLFVTFSLIVTSCGLYNRGWAAPAQAGSFHDAHLECVAAHDPNHVADIDDTGSSYRLSGWFVDEKRKAPVVQCMKDKGWHEIPVVLAP